MKDFIYKIKNKLQENYWLKSSLIVSGGRISMVFFGFFSFLILVRVLSKEDFGAWIIFTSVAAIIETLKLGFVKNPIIKYAKSSETGDQKYIESSSLILNSICSVIFGLIIYFSASYVAVLFDSPQLELVLKLYLLKVGMLVLADHFDIVQEASLQYLGTFYNLLFRNLIFLLLLLTYVILDWNLDLIDLIWFQNIGMAIGMLSTFLTARKLLNYTFLFNLNWIKKLFHFGKYTLGTSLSSMVMRSVDNWMLGSILNTVAVSIYNPALRIANIFEVPTSTIATIVFPITSERTHTEGLNAAKYMYEKSVAVILALMIPFSVLVIIFSKPIVLLIAGSEYAESSTILNITMLYGLFMPFNRQAGTILEAIGLPHVNFNFIIIFTAFNVISNYIFIVYFGVMGAAYGTLITYAVLSVANLIYLKHKLNVELTNVFIYLKETYLSVKDVKKFLG
ncbi:MAG: flippase [Cyclobacteriaceae bacterium]|nr:flippase [Cyclobacteriaceae bacterium]